MGTNQCSSIRNPRSTRLQSSWNGGSWATSAETSRPISGRACTHSCPDHWYRRFQSVPSDTCYMFELKTAGKPRRSDGMLRRSGVHRRPPAPVCSTLPWRLLAASSLPPCNLVCSARSRPRRCKPANAMQDARRSTKHWRSPAATPKLGCDPTPWARSRRRRPRLAKSRLPWRPPAASRMATTDRSRSATLRLRRPGLAKSRPP